MNQCWQGKKKGICCRTWLEMDLFCSLQRVWKAEIIITGHKGQRNKSGKSRRAHSGEQRGGKNSPLVPLRNGVDTQRGWYKRHLDTGPADEIKEENNCKEFGNRAVPTKGQSSNASPRTFCRRVSGAVVCRIPDAIKAQYFSPYCCRIPPWKA